MEWTRFRTFGFAFVVRIDAPLLCSQLTGFGLDQWLAFVFQKDSDFFVVQKDSTFVNCSNFSCADLFVLYQEDETFFIVQGKNLQPEL